MAPAAVDRSTAPRGAEIVPPAPALPLAQHTQLSDTYTIPWRDGLRLGCGFDAATGMAVQTAVNDDFVITSLDDSSKQTRYSIQLCHDTDSFLKVFSDRETGRGSLNLDSLALSAGHSAAELDKISHSSTSFSVVIRSQHLYSSQALYKGQHSFKPEAVKLFAELGARAFREQYGDCFYAGHRSMSQFSAVVTFRCQDSSQSASLQESLNVRVTAGLSTNPIRVSGEGELTTELEKISEVITKQVSVSVDIFMFGQDSSKPTDVPAHVDALKNTDEILKYLKSFEASVKPAVATVELRAYYMVQANAGEHIDIPRVIPFPPQTFTELASLKTLLLRCTIAEKSLKAHPGGETVMGDLKDRLELVRTECGVHQAALVTDGTLRSKIMSQLERLRNDLDRSISIFALYQKLRRNLDEQPRPAGSANTAKQDWAFGRTSASTNPIAIYQKHFVQISAPSRLFIVRWHTVNVSHLKDGDIAAEVVDDEGRERVVGWTVTSLRGRGGWKTAKESGLLLASIRDIGAMFMVSSGMRVDEWQIILYVVRDPFLDRLVEYAV